MNSRILTAWDRKKLETDLKRGKSSVVSECIMAEFKQCRETLLNDYELLVKVDAEHRSRIKIRKEAQP